MWTPYGEMGKSGKLIHGANRWPELTQALCLSAALPGGGRAASRGVIPGTGGSGSSANALAAIQHKNRETADQTESTSPVGFLGLKQWRP